MYFGGIKNETVIITDISLTSYCSHCRIPATTVEMYQPKSRRWAAMRPSTDGFWVFGSDPVDKPVVTPFRVRLTAANGKVVTDRIPRIGNDMGELSSDDFL